MSDGSVGGLSGQCGDDCGIDLRLEGRGGFCVSHLKKKTKKTVAWSWCRRDTLNTKQMK